MRAELNRYPGVGIFFPHRKQVPCMSLHPTNLLPGLQPYAFEKCASLPFFPPIQTRFQTEPRLLSLFSLSVQLSNPPAASIAAPIALEQMNHHQPSYLVPASRPQGAGGAKTYSLLVASRVVRDAVRALAAVAQAAVDVRARRAHAAAVPALARHGRRGGESIAGVGLREETPIS